jgi:hypothetical protein
MEAPLTLHVVYTMNLRGDLEILPRLYSLIKKLRAEYARETSDSSPVDSNTLLVDLGNACAPGVWHCDVTGGRSMLIALDGMGYHAANVTGYLTPEGRIKLADTVRLGLVDAVHPHDYRGIRLTCEPQPDTPQFQIYLAPGDATRIAGSVLYLAGVETGQVGMAQVNRSVPMLITHDVISLSSSTPPDPTISGVIEFVLSEARYFQRRQAL